MKRVFLITGSVLLTILVSGMLNRETRAVQAADMTIRKQTREITDDLVRVEPEKTALREAAAESRRQTAHDESGMQFDPKFVDWLLAGNYAEVPRDLVPVLRAALGFPWNDSPDAVLISKAALRDLTLRGPVRNDKLSPAVCAVLSITPDEQVQLESAMAQSRGQYLDWARSNLQREGASTNGLLKYTIPAALELSVHLTNQLYAAFQNAVGAQRKLSGAGALNMANPVRVGALYPPTFIPRCAVFFLVAGLKSSSTKGLNCRSYLIVISNQ
jgi:hypothetical protein